MIGAHVEAEADFIELFDGGPAQEPGAPAGAWKVAVIDDDEAVHEGTRFALRDFHLDGRGIKLMSARSAAQGRALLADHPDMAVVLLDVVMESDDAGLALVDHVRQELGNETVRIILRTGQPGQAPERKVVVDYDINDYKAKTELTADKLFTALASALRSYEQLRRLVEIRQGLEFVIDSGGELLDATNGRQLAEAAAGRALRLVDDVASAVVTLRVPAMSSRRRIARAGERDPAVEALAEQALDRKATSVGATRSVFYADAGRGCEVAVAIGHGAPLTPSARALADLFSTRVSVVLDNLRLRRELEASNADLERCVEERTANLVAANERLEAQGERLRRANIFKNEILGTIAHDLKNPLGVMLGRAQILREILDIAPLPAAQAEAQISEIREAGRRLTAMIDTLISNAMLDAADMRLVRARVDVADLARQIVETNRASAERKGQTLRFTATGPLHVSGDVERLREAIDNLVDNAIKYSPAGAVIEASADGAGGEAVVRVHDGGPGLSPEDATRVFGRFQRLSAKPTGGESSTGLGLSIVKRIVELHGGTIAAENHPGGGAVFTVCLPFAPAGPGDETESEEAAS